MIRHVVLFKLTGARRAYDREVVTAVRLAERMGAMVPALRDWYFGGNCVTRPDAYDFVAIGLVDDESALGEYLTDPYHQRVARAWDRISERAVVDVRERSHDAVGPLTLGTPQEERTLR